MSNITITDKGKYYESSRGAWSRDGVAWVGEDGIAYSAPTKLRLAFKQQILDSQAAEVAKVGDWVTPTNKGHGKYGEVMQVVKTDTYRDRVWLVEDSWFIDDKHYKIVPEPEPEVFTGDPSEWGAGVYSSWGGGMFIVVDDCGTYTRMSADGYVYEPGDIHTEYTRISANPADIISDKVKGVE